MADIARSIPAPEVHPLAGSTSPGAAKPVFRPVLPPKPKPQVRPRLEASTPPADPDDGPRLDDHVGPDLSGYSPSDRVLLNLAKKVSAMVRGSEAGEDLQAAVRDLGEAEPKSLVALGMKADACVDCVVELGDSDGLTNLGLSIWHDAVRLATASKMMGAEPLTAPQEDWSFRDMVRRWAVATVEWKGWADLEMQIEETLTREGKIPEALFVRETDFVLFVNAKGMPGMFEREWFGHPKTIAALRGKTEEAPKSTHDVAARAARIAEILTTYEWWEQRGDACKQSQRAARCGERSAALGREADELHAFILRARVLTLDGLLLKAVVGLGMRADEWYHLADLEEEIEEAESGGEVGYTRDYILRDILRLGISRGITPEQLAGEGEPARDPDHELLAAIADLHRIDALQADLCARQRCDTDKIPGYDATDKEWAAAVQRIADLPAQTMAGAAAKAGALLAKSLDPNGRSVAEDLERLCAGAGLSAVTSKHLARAA